MSTHPASKAFRAVIVDFFGTIACHPEGPGSRAGSVFERHGYLLHPETEAEYFQRYDGIEHGEHSVSAEAYEAWVRQRRTELAMACAVSPNDIAAVVDSLGVLDWAPVVAYPDAAPTLQMLRKRGFRIGVCSNWGWDLESPLREAGLFELVDVAVTSARAGARKPHQRIFTVVTEALAVAPEDVLFVGDSLRPDVYGPVAAGMSAAHLRRPEDSSGPAPPLPDGAVRVASLSELLDWDSLSRPVGTSMAPK